MRRQTSSNTDYKTKETRTDSPLNSDRDMQTEGKINDKKTKKEKKKKDK